MEEGDITLWQHGQDLLEGVLTKGHLAFLTEGEVSEAVNQSRLSESAAARLLGLLRQPETSEGMLPIFLYDPGADTVYQLFDEEIVRIKKWRPFDFFGSTGGTIH